MRDEVGVLIGLTYLPVTKQYISLQWDQHVFLFPGPPWSRTYVLEARKQNSKASSSNTSESQFLQNDLAVVPFKLTIIRSPESPQ